MGFWKRIRWIGSALALVVWMVAVVGGSHLGRGDLQVARPLPCTTNCL